MTSTLENAAERPGLAREVADLQWAYDAIDALAHGRQPPPRMPELD